ncbi:MAG: alpha-ketoacid dehydrogenase subunit beta [Thermodesulfobacteriota bacterium]
MSELYYGQAIGRALADEMRRDERVVLWGEDVAQAGGIFGVSRGLLQTFGPRRVKDTPISELALTGAAVGAAMTGLRPVIEIMFMDFIGFALDPLFNQAAKISHMFAGQFSVPLVVRTAAGGGFNAGPHHSQCLEAWLAHVPGLKVVAPSTPADAYGLLVSSIRDDNPVVFVEHKGLYARKGILPEEPGPLPLGKAAIVREGEDLTLVSYALMVHQALEAAASLAKMGVSVEVIDLRTLNPWDKAGVLESVRKTNRLLIVQEAVKAFGVGAEIAATVAEEALDFLDAPIVRLGAPFAPPAVSKPLEKAFLVSPGQIVEAARRMVGT